MPQTNAAQGLSVSASGDQQFAIGWRVLAGEGGQFGREVLVMQIDR